MPHLHSTRPPPLQVSPFKYCNDVWYKKTRIVCLPSDEKKFKNVFTLFDTIHVLRIYVTDGRTSRRTPHDGIIIIIITTTITITISITEAF